MGINILTIESSGFPGKSIAQKVAHEEALDTIEWLEMYRGIPRSSIHVDTIFFGTPSGCKFRSTFRYCGSLNDRLLIKHATLKKLPKLNLRGLQSHSRGCSCVLCEDLRYFQKNLIRGLRI